MMTTHFSFSDAWLQVFVIAVAIVVAALIIARAIAQQTHDIHRIAGEKVFAATLRKGFDADAWRDMVEQIAIDVLHQPLRVTTFIGLNVGSSAHIRFALSDGRILEFTTARPVFPFRPRFDLRQSPQCCAEIHAVCLYFAQEHQQAAIARDACWWVRVLRASPAQMPRTATTPLPRQS